MVVEHSRLIKIMISFERKNIYEIIDICFKCVSYVFIHMVCKIRNLTYCIRALALTHQYPDVTHGDRAAGTVRGTVVWSGLV